MQPTKLHGLFAAWGFEGDPKFGALASMKSESEATLMNRGVQWILVVAPALNGLSGLMDRISHSSSGPITIGGLFLGSSSHVGPVFAAVGTALMPSVIAATIWIFVGTNTSIAFGVAYALHNLVGSLINWIFGCGTAMLDPGTSLGLITGVALGGPLSAASIGRLRRRHLALLLSAILIWFSISIVYYTPSTWTTPKRWESFEHFLFVLLISGLRLPIWPFEAAQSAWLAVRARLRPASVRRLAQWLPFRLDDLIFLPLPGLRSFFLSLAEVDADLAMTAITEATASIGQSRAAQLALVELRARELERAAIHGSFTLVASLDLPFLPTIEGLEPGSPLRFFRSAAHDLEVGTDLRISHVHRERALAHAEKTLVNDFQASVTDDPSPSPLAQRLLKTARDWLDVIRNEKRRLERDKAHRPEVPTVFIAGVALTPSKGAELFRGRDALIGLINHDLGPERCGLLVVFGQRRMGKTSLRHLLPVHLGSDTTVVPLTFESLADDEQRSAPHRKLVSAVHGAVPSSPAQPEGARWEAALAWLEEVDRSLGDQRVIVVIDELERVEAGIRAGWCATEMLDLLRAAGNSLKRVRFVLLTAHSLHRLGHHWLDKLIGATKRTVSYLDEDAARELLLHPVRNFPDIYPEGGVDRILARTRCHPFLLQKVGDELTALLNARGGLRRATSDELDEVFDRIVMDVLVFDELFKHPLRTDAERDVLRRLAFSLGDVPSSEALQDLRREEYVELRDGRPVIAVPLFAEWIRANAVRPTEGATPDQGAAPRSA